MLRVIAVLAVAFALACSDHELGPGRPVPPPRGLLYAVPDTPGVVIRLAGPDGAVLNSVQLGDTLYRAIQPLLGPVVSPDGEMLAVTARAQIPSAGNTFFRRIFLARMSGTVTSARQTWDSDVEPGTRPSVDSARVSLPLPRFDWSPGGAAFAVQYEKGDGFGLSFSDPVSGHIGNGFLHTYPDRFGVVAWSPDTAWVLDGNWLLDTRHQYAHAWTLPDSLVGVGWTPDGRVLATRGCNAGVWSWRMGASTAEAFLPPPYWYASVSFDGTRILALTDDCAGQRSAMMLDAHTQGVLWSAARATWAAWRP